MFYAHQALFGTENSFFSIELNDCKHNNRKVEDFLKIIHVFTEDKFRVTIAWKTRKTEPLFPYTWTSPNI